ncbi:hypothetical protein MHBO_002590, partial [Bonamia ostreae]
YNDPELLRMATLDMKRRVSEVLREKLMIAHRMINNEEAAEITKIEARKLVAELSATQQVIEEQLVASELSELPNTGLSARSSVDNMLELQQTVGSGLISDMVEHMVKEGELLRQWRRHN